MTLSVSLRTAARPAGWVWLLPLVVLAASAPLWLHRVEPGLFIAINSLCAPVAAPIWTGLSLLGNGWGLLGVTAPLLVCAPRLLWAWLCAAPFAVAFARAGKYFIESPRPAAVVDNAQMRIVGEVLHNVSMPSGHTLTAFAVASALYCALPPSGRKRHWWLLVLAAGTGLSRIAVGAHWPGDVAVGAGLGLWAGLLGGMLLQRVPPAWSRPGSWALRLVVALQASAIYTLLTEVLDFAENAPLQHGLALLTGVTLLVYLRREFVDTRNIPR